MSGRAIAQAECPLRSSAGPPGTRHREGGDTNFRSCQHSSHLMAQLQINHYILYLIAQLSGPALAAALNRLLLPAATTPAAAAPAAAFDSTSVPSAVPRCIHSCSEAGMALLPAAGPSGRGSPPSAIAPLVGGEGCNVVGCMHLRYPPLKMCAPSAETQGPEGQRRSCRGRNCPSQVALTTSLTEPPQKTTAPAATTRLAL